MPLEFSDIDFLTYTLYPPRFCSLSSSSYIYFLFLLFILFFFFSDDLAHGYGVFCEVLKTADFDPVYGLRWFFELASNWLWSPITRFPCLFCHYILVLYLISFVHSLSSFIRFMRAAVFQLSIGSFGPPHLFSSIFDSLSRPRFLLRKFSKRKKCCLFPVLYERYLNEIATSSRRGWFFASSFLSMSSIFISGLYMTLGVLTMTP